MKITLRGETKNKRLMKKKDFDWTGSHLGKLTSESILNPKIITLTSRKVLTLKCQIKCIDGNVECILLKNSAKNGIHCILDELKPIFDLPKIGTHGLLLDKTLSWRDSNDKTETDGLGRPNFKFDTGSHEHVIYRIPSDEKFSVEPITELDKINKIENYLLFGSITRAKLCLNRFFMMNNVVHFQHPQANFAVKSAKFEGKGKKYFPGKMEGDIDLRLVAKKLFPDCDDDEAIFKFEVKLLNHVEKLVDRIDKDFLQFPREFVSCLISLL